MAEIGEDIHTQDGIKNIRHLPGEKATITEDQYKIFKQYVQVLPDEKPSFSQTLSPEATKKTEEPVEEMPEPVEDTNQPIEQVEKTEEPIADEYVTKVKANKKKG